MPVASRALDGFDLAAGPQEGEEFGFKTQRGARAWANARARVVDRIGRRVLGRLHGRPAALMAGGRSVLAMHGPTAEEERPGDQKRDLQPLRDVGRKLRHVGLTAS